MGFDLSLYKGKRVFISGHTGFKGSWLSVLLVNLGADVIGYSLCSKSGTRLFDICGVEEHITHNVETAIQKTVEWSKEWAEGNDILQVMDRQIKEFLEK